MLLRIWTNPVCFFFQLMKFAIPTIFDEVLNSRRDKRKKKRKKKPVITVQEKDPLSVPQDLPVNAQTNIPVIDTTAQPECENRDEQVKDSDLTTNPPVVRLIFSAKRDLETNERTVFYPASKTKKVCRKRKLVSNEAATSTGPPRGREALEEFRQKCGLDLSRQQISARRLLTQIPNEHNYAVHESAKLLKIKLTQAQVLIPLLWCAKPTVVRSWFF